MPRIAQQGGQLFAAVLAVDIRQDEYFRLLELQVGRVVPQVVQADTKIGLLPLLLQVRGAGNQLWVAWRICWLMRVVR